MEAGLYCTRCHDETLHRVVYINDKIQSIECAGCNRLTNMKIDIKKELYGEVYDRVSTKPSRLKKEYKQNSSKFFSGIPIRVISKPYRFVKYVNKTRKVFKKSKEF